MRRRSQTHRPNRRPYLQRAIAEVLEERQMLSLTIDVRAADGSKSLQLSNIGQVVNLQVWAEITDPQNQPTQDGVQDIGGSFLSTNVGPGPVAGNLSAATASPFNYLASQNGTVQDLNGDGNLDVGSNNDSSVTNFFLARSQNLETSSSGTIVGNALEFEIGTLTYTVTHLNYGGETDINFRPRGSSGITIAAVWREDGQAEDNTTGTFTAGAPFVVTAPPAKLVFTTQPANTTIGTTIDPPNGVAVAVEDAADNIITSNADNISLSLSPNSSALTGTTTAQASSGVASFNTLAVSTPGANYTLTATDSSASLTAQSQTFNVNPPLAYNFQNVALLSPNISFNGGFDPQSQLYIDSSGNLFGTTSVGGPSGRGTVFEIAEPSGVYSTLVSFTGTGGAAPGQNPYAGLISDGNGNLFGTTEAGGPSNYGTVFELAGPTHAFSTLFSFTGLSGAYPGVDPTSSLITDGNGNLLGTTAFGGTSNSGTVFELAGPNHIFSSLFSFTGIFGQHPGDSPESGLASDGNGNLFGTTDGGLTSSDYGSVFELSGPTFTFSTLLTFTGNSGAYPGASPQAALTSDGNGNLFGTTLNGGTSGDGTVFELAGPTHTFSSLVSFTGTTGVSPGLNPYAGLTSDGNGNLFGTTKTGGTSNFGTVFELAGPSHTFSSLISLTGYSGTYPDAYPYATLTADANGNLLGTTYAGGTFYSGALFEIPASAPGTLVNIANFADTTGFNPASPTFMDSSGNLFGTTLNGGAYGGGSVYEISEPSGIFSTLVSFSNQSGPSPGLEPNAELTSDGNGDIFGTTRQGGASNNGTIFELAGPTHTLSTVISLTGTSGAYLGSDPTGGLISDGNGNLLGVTESGGSNSLGTVFELAGPSHTFSTLLSFGGTYPEGFPQAGLTSDGNGNLFGITTEYSGSQFQTAFGTVFELAGPTHAYSTLVSFTGNSGAYPGKFPFAPSLPTATAISLERHTRVAPRGTAQSSN